MAVNLCRGLARKKRPTAFTELATDDESTPEEAIEDEVPLQLDQVEECELEGALARAVADLPAVYRAAVMLRYTEELSYEGIATVLKLTVNTVRAHLFRAKAMLRKSLFERSTGNRPNQALGQATSAVIVLIELEPAHPDHKENRRQAQQNAGLERDA